MIRKLLKLFVSVAVLFVAGFIGMKLSETPELHIWRWYDVAPWQEVSDPFLEMALQIEQDYPQIDVITLAETYDFFVIIIDFQDAKSVVQGEQFAKYIMTYFDGHEHNLRYDVLIYVHWDDGDGRYWMDFSVVRPNGAPFWYPDIYGVPLKAEFYQLVGNPYQ